MKQILALVLLLVGTQVYAQQQIELDDITKRGTFRTRGIQGFNSMQDGQHYSAIENGKLVKKRFEDDVTVRTYEFYNELLHEGKKIRPASYMFNKAEDKMLMFTEGESIYRHSTLYKVFIYDLESQELTALREGKVLHASFSPQSDKVAYVFENNLYYYDLNERKHLQITNDGSDQIINGNCDWVYEEEFGFTKAYQWSPSGNYIAFYRFDQSRVPEFNMAMYGSLYPKDYKFKYPKAGEINSKLKIGLHQIGSPQSKFYTFNEEYIPRIKWTQYDESLIVYTLNRHQNHLKFYEVKPFSMQMSRLPAEPKVVYEEKNEYYIDINDEITFLKNKNSFLHTSEKDGFNHIYLQDLRKSKSRQITKGNWDVTSLHGIDEGAGQIYYTSVEESPLERNMYRIKMDGRGKTSLTPEKGYHAISNISKNFKYFVDNYSTANTPPSISLKKGSGELVRVLRENEEHSALVSKYGVAKKEIIQVALKNGTKLNGYILKPKMEVGTKYPLIMFQYSGPGSQMVANRYGGSNYWFHQMMVQKGYVVACVDGRGTGYRGEEFKKMTYQQLGRYETDDQIEVAQELSKLDFIDADRIGIWGWSYGGYMSSICLAKGADVFKSAIAIAPVTNWRYYDNIYTERYMRTPQENPSGYDDNSPVNMVDKIKGNYLIVHGSADDNVHMQNTIEMLEAMIQADVEYDSEIYPDKNHGIYGGNTRHHLYRRMTNFWLEKL